MPVIKKGQDSTSSNAIVQARKDGRVASRQLYTETLERKQKRIRNWRKKFRKSVDNEEVMIIPIKVIYVIYRYYCEECVHDEYYLNDKHDKLLVWGYCNTGVIRRDEIPNDLLDIVYKYYFDRSLLRVIKDALL